MTSIVPKRSPSFQLWHWQTAILPAHYTCHKLTVSVSFHTNLLQIPLHHKLILNRSVLSKPNVQIWQGTKLTAAFTGHKSLSFPVHTVPNMTTNYLTSEFTNTKLHTWLPSVPFLVQYVVVIKRPTSMNYQLFCTENNWNFTMFNIMHYTLCTLDHNMSWVCAVADMPLQNTCMCIHRHLVIRRYIEHTCQKVEKSL